MLINKARKIFVSVLLALSMTVNSWPMAGMGHSVNAATAGTALQFNGSNQYVTFGTSAGLDTGLGAQVFTIETWFKKTGAGIGVGTGTGGIASAIPLVTKGRGEAENSNVDMNYFFGIDSTGVLAADFEECAVGMGAPCTNTGNGGQNYPAKAVTLIQNNVWYHGAVTYDGQTWKFYLNGIQDGPTTTLPAVHYPRWDSIQHAGIGTAMTSTGVAAGFFQGVIDEARIWNVVRTQSQIQSDMSNELTSGTGLIGRWGLNEGTGNTANNSIAGRPSGTLTNSPTWVTGFPIPDTTPPAAPQNLAATPASGSISLTWTANTESDLAGYNVYRSATSPVPTNGTPLNGSTLLATPSYSDNCLNSSAPFYYVVVAVDSSNNKSSQSNEVSTTPLASPPGGCALSFNGTNQYVTFGVAPALGTTSFTLETWFYWTGSGTTSYSGTGGITAIPLVTKGRCEEDNSNKDMNYFLGIQGGKLAADLEEGAGQTSPGLNHPVVGTTTITTNIWHHAAATYDSGNGVWNLYLDGAQDATLTIGPNKAPRSDSIQHAALGTALNSAGSPGGSGDCAGTGGFFQGVMDEARIWNYARTRQQIGSTINQEVTSASGLIGRWGMNEANGSVVADSSGSAINGTATNGPTWVAGAPFNTPIDTTPPVAPTNLMASPRPAAVQLEWTANTETDLAGYNIYRNTASPVTKGTPVNSSVQTSPSYLDEGVTSGTTYYYAVTAVDSSGNESGLSNEDNVISLPPPPAEALKLGSGNAYIALGNKADTATFTLETWLRRDGTGTATTTGTGGVILVPVITNGTAEAETPAADINYFFGIQGSNGVLCADFEEAQMGASPSLNHPVCGATPLQNNTWYHAAATYDGTTWKLYLNGNLDGQLAVGQPANAANISQLAFGTSMTTGNATAGFFNGTLDEVRIWNYARSQAQIAGTINTKITTPQAGLLGRWGLDEGSGITAGDSSGNNITGIITGSGSSWVAGSPFNAVVNLPPDAPVLVSPGSGATGVSTDTTLSVDVSDPESQPLDVTFYGRPLQSSSGADFTLVVIPDTQYYASAYPSIYNAQMSWVANNLATSNIVYVAGLGDNVDTASTIAQWTNADTAYDILDAAGVPYGVAAGNHDGAPSGTANFNTYFGTSRFAGKPYIGGHYGSDNDNHYDLFEASGLKFIVVYIEYDDSMTNTNNAVLQWANGLLQYNSDRRAIVISHNMLQGGTSTAFSAQGQAIYNALKGNSNLFLIMGGHLDVASRRTDTDSGHAIYTLRSDYQSVDSQQSGYLRIMRFSPADGMIYVRTYSPTQNKDYDKADAAQNNFSLPYSMGGAAFQAVGTAAGVSSGSTASVPWSGLANGSQYEWYVVSSDGTHQTSSDIWNFTTAGLNQAPVCEPASLTTAEDTSGRITLSCTDADGDPLTYSIVSDPAHGTLSGTGPEYTYTPAPNYNGPDSFTFKANDGKVDSTAAAASITVSPINDPPVCTSGQLTTAEDTPGDFPLSCTDLEGDALTYGVVTPPAHGLASISGTMLTYTPVANYFGSDRLTFKANDGAADSAVSTVDITVTPVNDAPVCHDVSITTNQGTAGETTSNCTDVDGDPLTYSIVADPQHGTAIVAGSMLRYTPAADFSGTDSFTYQASDGSLPSNEAGVAVAVNAVNTRPSIIQDPADLAVNQNDPATFTAQAGGNPTPKVQWSVSTDGGSTWSDIAGATSTTYSFTAQESDHGSQYRAVFTNDAGTATTNAATLSVNIAPAITAQPGNATVTAGEAASFSAAASGRPSPTVQWESSTDGTTWTAVTGAASETYSFTCQAANNGNQFRAVFANPAGTATTDPVTLTVNFAPNITLQPAGQTVTAGQTAAFSAAASGNPTPVVQWQISEDSGANWSDLAGATSTSYSFTAQAEDNGRLYRAVFVNGVGTPVSSSAATLTVNYPPAAPTGLNATAGSARQIYLAWTDASVNEANFELERSTTGVDGSFSLLAMLNADVTTYSDTGLSFASGYCYRVRATNATGSSDYSNVACATTNPEPNNALDFGSGTAYVTFGNPPALELPRFTLETWFKREGVGTPAYTGSGGITAIPLITKGMHEADGSNVDMNYFLGIDSTTNTLAADFEDAATGANHPVSGTTVIQNDTWHHAAVTFDGTRWQLFLDGHLEAELAVGQQPRSDSIQHAGLGVAMNSIGVTEGHFDGVMDEVRIWNYPRTQAQIQGTINSQLTTSQNGLIGRWSMNEISGTAVTGSAGTTIDGTITGSGSSWVAGAPFNLDFQPPAAPTNLTSAAAGNSIALAWTDNANNETAFQLERSTTGINGIYTLLVTASANATTYSDNGLAYVTEYCYRVSAANGNGESAYSNPACATTGTGPAYALDFGSGSAYVTFGDPAKLDLQLFTIETWFKRTGAGLSNTTGTGGIADAIPLVTHGSPQADGSNVDANWILAIDDASDVLAADFEDMATGLNHPVYGVTPIAENTWHHAAATYDGTTWRLYLDGNLEATLVVNAAPRYDTIQHAGLGTMIESGGATHGHFEGMLDEVRIWNTARSQDEIAVGINSEITSASGLVARYGFSEGAGGLVHDSVTSPAAADGTITNSGYGWVPGAPFDINFSSPTAPTGLTATAAGKTINLAWTDNANNESAFEVERSTIGINGPYTQLATVGANIAAYSDISVAYETEYCYRVRAANVGGKSDYTTAVCATVGAEPNKALALGSSHAYVTLGNNADLPQFTLETWLRRDGAGVTANTGTGGKDLIPLITNGTAEAETAAADINYFFGIQGSDGVLCADFEEAQTGTVPGQNHPVCGTTPLVTGTWYHAAATYDGTTWRIYLNGNLEAALAVNQPANTANISQLAFGTSLKTDNSALGFFDGTLDEVRIWDRARTQDEIIGTINTAITTPQTGLVGRWSLNEGAGTAISGSAGTSIDGDITGSGSSWVNGAPFNITFNPPAAPTSLSTTAYGKSVALAWTDNADNEASYQVERSMTGSAGDFTLLATVGANTTAFYDTGLAFVTEYCYRVRAVNVNGPSAYTDPACATTGTEAAYGLDFGNGTGYVTFGNTQTLALTQFTLETWFKREGTGSAAYTGSGGITAIPLITKGMHEADGSNVDMNYFLGIDSTTNTLAADFEDAATGANHPVSGTTVIQNDTWHHAAVTFDGTRWQLFLDGNLEAELAVGQQPRSDSIQHAGLGVAMNSIGVTEGHFDGVMDEVRIWNYPRTQAQIQGTINIQVRDPQTGLVARYGMDEGTGTTISSTAGTALSGTITGSGYSWVAGAPFNLNFNHMPNPPTVVSPVNGATGVGTNATLSVTASDPDSDPLTVTFYGRPTTGASGPGFTLVALPDTQNYTTLTGGSATFNTMTQWVVDNQSSQNIVFTSHLGDITESGNNDTTETQWQIANTAMSKLEKGTIDPSDDVPFGVVAGNHDVAGGTSLFEKYFGVARFSGRPYYGGHYGTDNLNSYSVFNTTGMSFIVLNLQCTGTTPPTAVLDWADGLLKADLNRRGIVVCHTLFASTTALSVEGTVVFNALNDNPNLFLMLGGHVAGVGQLALKGMDGHTINLLLSDFQGEANGGNGWLRIIKFSPATNQIHITTYSPTLNQYKTDAANQFDLDYPMAGASFSQVGTASIDSGGTASVSWTGLNPSNQYEWYATVSDGSGSTSGQTWSFTTISNSAPTIVSQPTSQTVTAGQQVSFSAAADGQPSPSVQWQVSTDNGLTWSDLTGATSTTYSFTAQAADNGKQYRAVFTNNVATVATIAATLTVHYAPTITTQPANQMVGAGQSATFTAAASGNPAPTVQWQVSVDSGLNWSTIAGATSTTYTFPVVATDNGKQFRAVFSNGIGAQVSSNAATLTVNTAPVITAHPQSITIVAGQIANFHAAAVGNPTPTIQWQISTNNGKAWKDISGAMATTYSFTAQTTDSGKQFRAVFTNSLGTAITNAAKLTVSAATAPVVTTQPAYQTVADGQTASFSAVATGNPAPTVQWQVTTNGSLWSDITGATSTTYSFIAHLADSGKQFRAIFTNSTGNATTNAALLTVTSPGSVPVMTTQPANVTVDAGQTATFTAAASGNPTPTVKWQVSTNNGGSWMDINGATSGTYSFTAQATDNGKQFRAIFTNSNGTATSNAATLTVNSTTSAPVITFQPASKSVKAGTLVTFTAAATGNPTPTVQWQVSTNRGRTWTNISEATVTSYSLMAQKTDSGNQYRAIFTNSSGSATTNAATLTVR